MDNYFELTVIVPTHNRAPILQKCIRALGRQTIPRDSYEIIVSDDGSEDDTRLRAEQAAREVSCEVTYLHQPNQGANRARNQAIRHAKGRLLLFINDDTIATPTMLDEHLRTHRHYPAEEVGVLGRVTISPEVPPSLFAKVHLDAGYELWKGQVELDWRAFYTCNASVKKAFLLKYGIFEESIRYHEDVELSERLSHHGFFVVYNPEALAYHDHFLTEESYLNAAKMDGKALAIWYRKAPHLAKELASVGFYLTDSASKRLKYFIADLIINKHTVPHILGLARWLGGRREDLALLFYRKVYKALERESIRDELRTY